MASVFLDGELWQHATFEFKASEKVGEEDVKTYDKRGLPKVIIKPIKVTFKLRPKTSTRGDNANLEHVQQNFARYECRVVAVDDDFEKVVLPTEIKVNDVGEGTLNDRKCKATITNIAQSSLSPILTDILGQSTELEIFYSTKAGSK